MYSTSNQIIVLVIFGLKRLPDINAGIGKGIQEFKRAISQKQFSVEDSSKKYRSRCVGLARKDRIMPVHRNINSRAQGRREGIFYPAPRINASLMTAFRSLMTLNESFKVRRSKSDKDSGSMKLSGSKASSYSSC